MGDIDLGTTASDTSTPAAPDGAPAAEPADTGSGETEATTVVPATPETPVVAAPEPRANVTARLAALSRENREATRAARAAEAKAKALEAKTTDFEGLLAKAETDPAAMDALFKRANLNFEKIVNRYADQTPDLSPEQIQAKAIEDLRAEVAAQKKARDDEREAATTAAAARQAESAKTETLGSITQAITKQADKYEICARLGDEAANDVFAEVVGAWNKAGRPELMPGEFDEAVQAAIELQELRYEERGKKLQKAAARAATPPAKTAKPTGLAPRDTDLPHGLTPTPISDKDADILAGLTDKTAPSYDSQRARPRTINSSLGGSAPPKTPARGTMDPRDALRAVLEPFQRQ